MHGRLGATVVDDGTRFEVWAPAAQSVEVAVRSADDGEPEVHALTTGDSGPGLATWTTTVDDATRGDRYAFRIDGGDWLPDPASRWQPDGVHGWSAVVDESMFTWTDDDWSGVQLADTVLYELHIGTFTPEGTFDAAIAELPRLRDLGITTIEIMPVAAFPGERNWGYDGVFPFAVQHSYGGPDALARFVDAAHHLGLAVVLDVVYNHIGPEGNVLGEFGPYFTDAYRTPWGDAINVAGIGSDGVRRYFIENAVGWIRDHHLDGLRLDAVHAIVDPTPLPFVHELTRAVHDEAERSNRTVLVTVESSANDPRIVRSDEHHGWGCDAVWNDDLHHALRVALTGERHAYYAAYEGASDVANAWDRRWVYSGRYSPTFGRRHGAPADELAHGHFIVFDTNHDHIGNTPSGTRLLADVAPDDPRHRLALAAILLSPFTPMLFMGEEYGEPAPFPYFIDHGDPDLVEAVREGRRREFSGADWSTEVADPADPSTFRSAVLDPGLSAEEPHRTRLATCRELLRVRRETPIVTDPNAQQHVSIVGTTVLVVRSTTTATATLIMNFSPDPFTHPTPDDPRASTMFDSDDAQWGGPGTDPSTIGAWAARLETST